MNRTGWRVATIAVAALVASASPIEAQAIVQPFVVNGSPSAISSRPYQAAILDVRLGPSNYTRMHCGGSVVAPTIVVTAGHCTYDSLTVGSITNPTYLRVLTGTGSLLSGGTTTAVSSIIRHPNYNPAVDETVDDIALLILATPVAAPAVALIPPQSDYRINLAGAKGIVSGWGCYQAGQSCQQLSHYPTSLRQATLPLHSNGYCSSFFENIGLDFDRVRSLCAGDPSAAMSAPGPCFGDSGGPLTVDGVGGKDLLIGVVSWGVQCGATPAAFTRISNYRSWLASNGVPITPAPFTSTAGPTIDSAAQLTVGDFDGDSFGDLLAYVPGTTPDPMFRGTSGNQFTTGTAATINGNYALRPCATNGDSATDLIMYGYGTRPDKAAFGISEPGSFAPAPTLTINGRYVVLAGDFTGDDVCDLVLYGPGSAPDRLMVGDGDGTFTLGAMAAVGGTYTPIVGDWNGDGTHDIFWYSATGSHSQWNGGISSFSATKPPSVSGTYTPIAGDFDGNGRDDILWYGVGSKPDVLWNSTSTGFHQIREVAINGTYTAATAIDVDNDGHDEIIWKTSTGSTFVSTWAL